jgi:hypothetical protein
MKLCIELRIDSDDWQTFRDYVCEGSEVTPHEVLLGAVQRTLQTPRVSLHAGLLDITDDCRSW